MPYFNPLLDPVLTYSPATSPHPLLNRLGDVSVNYYFVTESMCPGSLPAYSNEVAEFDFAILPGN